MKPIFYFLFLIPFSFFAQQIETDRPDQTEASSTVGKHNLQVESGFVLTYEEDESEVQSRQILAPTTLIRYGIFQGVELRLVSEFETYSDPSGTAQGINDLQLGTKVQIFRRENSMHEVAFMSHLVLPNGNRDLSGGTYGSISKLLVSHTFSDRLSLGYNLGYDNFGTENGNFTYSFAWGVGVNDRVGFYIETFGIYEEFRDFTSNFDGGITYLIQDNLQLDFSAGTGITQKMNYIGVGISWLSKK